MNDDTAKEALNISDIIASYFSGLTQRPFTGEKEEWEIWSSFIDMLCMLEIYMQEEKKMPVSDMIGFLPEDEELSQSLLPKKRTAFAQKAEVRRVFELILDMERLTLNGDSPLPLSRLTGADILGNIQILALMTAVCYAKNRKYEKVFIRIQNDPNAYGRPTAGLIHDLGTLFLNDDENDIALLFERDSFLNRFLLESSQGVSARTGAARPIILHERALSVIFGRSLTLGKAESFTTVLEGREEKVLYHDEEIEELMNAYTVLDSFHKNGVILLHGPFGTGKRFMVNRLACVLARQAMAIDTSRLLSLTEDEVREALRDIVLKAYFENMIVYLELKYTERFDHTRLQRAVMFLQSYIGLMILGSSELLPRELSLNGTLHTIEVMPPERSVQKSFWKHFADELSVKLSEDIDLDHLVSIYSLTPEKIKQALTCATLTAEIGADGFMVTRKLLSQKIRQASDVRFGDYATRLESPFEWDDLELTQLSKKMLTSAINRVKYRRVVNEDYGFNKKLPYGRGIVIALYGPPGTGKTMTAQVFAKELGMDIYRIDLSQIGSKYIGETEKNLGAVFEAAKYSNAILFFDEADALFAKRTDVNNSNDKHANAETAYLLQKMEEYRGVSILATNVMQNFDNAFKRRMTYIIPIEQPDEKARLKLWQKVFPKDVPLADDIDLKLLANAAKVSGSSIKSAAVAASYEAAASGRKVNMRDIISALDDEYKKSGHMSIADELYQLSQNKREF